MLVPMISHSPIVFWLLPVFGLRGAGYFLATTETISSFIRKPIGKVKIGNPPASWAQAPGRNGIMVAVLFLAASFYLLKQDLVRAALGIKPNSIP
jgi:hypothetical protein